MPVSTTSARISAVVPNPQSLTTEQMVDIVNGAKAANIGQLDVHVHWDLYQSGGSWWDDWAAAGLVIVLQALQNGLKVGLVLTGPVPSAWSTKANLTADFANFASRVAVSMRDQCKAMGLQPPTEYTIWDWPNIAQSWGAAPDPVEYTALLKATYPALKAVNPGIKVIFGNLAPVTTVKSVNRAATRALRNRPGATAPTELTPSSFLTSAYTAKVKGFFDAVGYTPVSIATPQQPKPPAPSGDSIKQSDDLRAVMVAKGDSAKKLHWTVGYDTDLFTQTQQALYLNTLIRFAEVRKDHVAAFNVYTYSDLA